MIVVALALGLAAVALLVSRSFDTKVLATLGLLPFLGWLQVHLTGVPWSLVESALVAVLVVSAIRERPQPSERSRRARPAYGLAGIVLLYLAVATAQAFSPDLPSALAGLRGLRLVVEPIAFFFVGGEVARRPLLLRRVRTLLLVTGAVVVLYGLRQWLGGFDAAELRFYRSTFPVAIRERRVFSTLPGASALGLYAALVGYVAVVRLLFRDGDVRRRWALTVLSVGAAVVVLICGQRGVIVAAVAGVAVILALGLLRPDLRRRSARTGQLVTVGVALLLALVVVTPVQDRRAASDPASSAFDSARIKLALLREGSQERSAELRTTRFEQAGEALHVRPLGAGTGLNLLIDRRRSGRASFLGQGGLGDVTTELPVQPIPSELLFYTIASETGVPGLALWSAIAAIALLAAGGIAVRHPDRERAELGMVAVAFLTLVILDAFTVDALSLLPVGAWFWLLVGIVGRWSQEDRRVATPAPPVTEPVAAEVGA
jgi:hypothetical protein